MTTKNDDDSCLYRFLEILEAIGMILFALIYMFSGPSDDDQPW